MTVFAAGVLLVSIYGLLQHFTGVHWFKDYPVLPADDFGFRVRGNFSHRLTFGNYYGTAAVFLLGYGITLRTERERSRRAFFVLASGLAIIVTILSYSRGVIAAIAVALILLGLILGRKYLPGMLAIVVIAALAVALVKPGLVGRYSDVAVNDLDVNYEGGRLFIWRNSLTILGTHPVIGVGAGNFETEYAALLRSDIPQSRMHVHAHNDLFNIAATHGLPCLLFFGAIWVTVLRRFWTGWRKSVASSDHRGFFLAAFMGSILFFLTSLTEATFADEEVRQMLMFIWAAGLWPWYKRSDT